ncbi:MAG: hypothetical protein ABI175_06205, partial [Polyangiales bacterium]
TFAACSANTKESGDPGPGGVDSGGGDLDGGGLDGGFNLDGSGPTDLASVALDPATATIDSIDGAPATQKFKLVGTRTDGSTIDLSGDAGIAWSATSPQIGKVAGGIFTANGTTGGKVTVKATYKTRIATAELTVRLKISSDSVGVDAPTKDKLRTTATADAAVKWAYPYDDTVFPRGLAAPMLMWNGSLAGDVFRVALSSETVEWEAFVDVGPPSRFTIPAAVWTKFTESTAGAATLTVSRASKGAVTLVTKLAWRIAPESMRGTIYYWANRQGRVLRIKPGSTSPDDFSASTLPATATDAAGTTYTCTMTCHAVSADGSTIVSGGDVFGGSYDLVTNKVRHDVGGMPGTSRRTWNTPALTPDGKYVVLNQETFGGPAAPKGLYRTSDGSHVDATNLDALSMWHPSFTPDGSHLVWTDFSAGVGKAQLMGVPFDTKTSKAATVMAKLVDASAVPTLPVIAYPSGSPDGKWVVYQRSSGGPAHDTYDTRGHCPSGCLYDNLSDLYYASTSGGGEIALAKANGTGYPFAAGARDQQLSFEPTFAPIAAGGYFWVVFTTRRTYGNLQTADLPEVKQLWVMAIEQTPAPGKDPSHAAFWLPGQELQYTNPDGSKTNSLNMRGYWALDPCHGDGITCTTGSECCGGYCEKAEGAATGTCKSVPPPCSAEGDHCETTDDCCGKGAGATCINHNCSQPPPR